MDQALRSRPYVLHAVLYRSCLLGPRQASDKGAQPRNSVEDVGLSLRALCPRARVWHGVRHADQTRRSAGILTAHFVVRKRRYISLCRPNVMLGWGMGIFVQGTISCHSLFASPYRSQVPSLYEIPMPTPRIRMYRSPLRRIHMFTSKAGEPRVSH